MRNKYLISFTIAGCLLGAGHTYAQSWVDVGTPKFTAGEADYESIVIGKNDTPFVAYEDIANNNSVTVMKFNGANWVAVGSPGFTGNLANYTNMVMDSSGTPYVIFQDGNDTQKATVMKFNGSGWEALGGEGISVGIANFTSLAIGSSDTLYAAFLDQADSCVPRISVKKFNGSSWVNVGPPRFSAIMTNPFSIAVHGNTPYITYPDSSIVEVFNGINWVSIGPPSSFGGTLSSMSLAFDNSGTPYEAYSDNANGLKATVIKYNGTAWVTVGSAGFSAGEADNVSIAIDGSGTPYVVYADATTADDYATVMKFNGTSWVTVGAPGFTGTLADVTSIAINSAGVPYVFYQGFVGLKGTVEKFVANTNVKNVAGTAGALRVFPDPNNGVFTLHITTLQQEDVIVTISNILGEQVKEFTATTNTDTQVQMNAAPGIYFVNTHTSAGDMMQKVVVE